MAAKKKASKKNVVKKKAKNKYEVYGLGVTAELFEITQKQVEELKKVEHGSEQRDFLEYKCKSVDDYYNPTMKNLHLEDENGKRINIAVINIRKSKQHIKYSPSKLYCLLMMEERGCWGSIETEQDELNIEADIFNCNYLDYDLVSGFIEITENGEKEIEFDLDDRDTEIRADYYYILKLNELGEEVEQVYRSF